ncbi:MAG: hypothetical protein IKA32_02795, partial [Lentisphaeria bacterium]|nr:hypothetical protein [Lentisphaeria bacterium]
MADAKPYHPNETVYDVDMSFESTLSYSVGVMNPYADLLIDWGDGTVTTEPKNGTNRAVAHQYTSSEQYTIRIYSVD